MIRRMKSFLRDQTGAAAIEYIVLLLPLIALVFTCFQIALAYHFTFTSQKAVENGARVAAVRDPVFLGMPERNARALGASAGDRCALGGCEAPTGGPWTCTFEDLSGAQCDAAAFEAIYQAVFEVSYFVEPEDIVVTYGYAGLGYADGPFVPLIQVAIRDRPFGFRFLYSLGLRGEAARGAQEVDRLPAVAATAIGEDMSSIN